MPKPDSNPELSGYFGSWRINGQELDDCCTKAVFKLIFMFCNITVGLLLSQFRSFYFHPKHLLD